MLEGKSTISLDVTVVRKMREIIDRLNTTGFGGRGTLSYTSFIAYMVAEFERRTESEDPLVRDERVAGEVDKMRHFIRKRGVKPRNPYASRHD